MGKKLSLQFEGFLNTPSMWKDAGHWNIPQYQIQDFSLPSDLERYLKIPSNLVLGKRVEHFFAYYVKHISTDNLIAQNVVIDRGKITIGELDFLLRNREEKLVHVELVYKFYLYDPDLKGEVEKWIGPNRKDSFITKLERLRNHQFPLLFKNESKEVLSSFSSSPEKKIDQKVCFRANLFVPLTMIHQKFPNVNNDCIRGFWIRKEEFREEKFGEYKFHSPKKPDWPIDPSIMNNGVDLLK